MSHERALLDFSLEFSKYIWFLLSSSRSKSMTKSLTCGTKFTIVTSQPQERFNFLPSLREFSHFSNFHFHSRKGHLSSSHFVT